MSCKHIKPDGNQCKAKAIKGSSLCFSHNPETKKAKQEAVIKGGKRTQIVDGPVFTDELDFSTADGITEALEQIAYAIGNKNLTPTRGNALVYACNASLNVIKVNGDRDPNKRGLFDLLKDSYAADRQRKQEEERLRMKKDLEEIENNKNTSE